MASSLKVRRLFYRRALWRGEGEDSFQELLEAVHDALPTTGERTYDYQDGKIQGLSCLRRSGFTFLHVGQFSPGDRASVIPTASTAERTGPDEYPAPEGTDYLSGDIMALCKGNHVIVCPSGAREPALGTYLEEAYGKVAGERLSTLMELSPVADVDAVRLIRREGVKKIHLSTSLYKASLDYELETERQSIIVQATEGIKALLLQDEGLAEISAKENISVHLEIRLDSRIKKGREISEAQIERLATSVISENDGFLIETLGGNQVDPESIRVSDKTRLKTFGSSVDPGDALEKMLGYYSDLMDRGILEQ